MIAREVLYLHDSELASLVGLKLEPGKSVGEMLNMTTDQLRAAGFSDEQITVIVSMKEIMTRWLSEKMKTGSALQSPERVVEFARAKIGGLPHEAFLVVFLDVRNEVIAHEVINEGTVDQVAVYPRRIVEKCLHHGAAGILIAHNHPSGHCQPSEEDKHLTRIIRDAGKVLDIRVLDHIIVGRYQEYFSFLEKGIL